MMETWKLFQRVMKVMGKRCKIYLLGIFLMSTCWAMFSVMVSLLLKSVVDAAQAGNADRIPFLIVGNVLGGLVVLLFYRMGAIVYNVEAKRAYGTICKRVFYHEVRLPYRYYEEHHSGEFLSKLSYDLEKTGDIYGSRLRRTVAPILQVGVFLIPMLVLSWQITICLIGVNLLMLFVNSRFIPPIKSCSKRLSQINSKMTEKISNLLQGMEQVRMNTAGKDLIAGFIEENGKFVKESHKKMIYSAFLESCSNGFDLLCALAFLMLGIFFVQRGYTTLGALTAIYSLYSNFSYQFLQLGRYYPELIGCLVNAQNIFEFLEEEEEPENWYLGQSGAEAETWMEDRKKKKKKNENGSNRSRLVMNLAEDRKIRRMKNENKNENEKKNENKNENKKGSSENDIGKEAIMVQRMNFYYQKEKPVFRNYFMSVAQGECVAITGSSGCGKTTLSKLLLSLYPVQGGTIFLNGKSYRDLIQREIRNQIAYVPQEPYLFCESVRENIRIGRLDADENEIENAAKLAYAHEFILELEQGYDTYVGERGNRLSGGQRQRIAIARAILKNAPILLLDEATSALDNESERLVNQALKSLKGRNTIIMIAHRPSTIALAEREIKMEK